MRLVVVLVFLLALWVPPAHAWSWPVAGPVVQAFSFDAAHPYGGGQHRGIDVEGAAGAQVRAPAAGTVSFAGSVPTSGRTVTIATPDGVAVTLTHLGTVAVSTGDEVHEGDVVGTVGPSGTPEVGVPYVHLGVRTIRDANGYVDPLSLLPAAAAPVAGGAGPAAAAPVQASSGAASPAPAAPAPVAQPLPAAQPVPAAQPAPAVQTSASQAPARPAPATRPAVAAPAAQVSSAAPVAGAASVAPSPAAAPVPVAAAPAAPAPAPAAGPAAGAEATPAVPVAHMSEPSPVAAPVRARRAPARATTPSVAPAVARRRPAGRVRERSTRVRARGISATGERSAPGRPHRPVPAWPRADVSAHRASAIAPRPATARSARPTALVATVGLLAALLVAAAMGVHLLRLRRRVPPAGEGGVVVPLRAVPAPAPDDRERVAAA